MRILVKQSWLSVCAGLIYGLAWEPIGFWPLAFVAWAVWLAGLLHRSREDLFVHSLLFSLTAWLIPFYWVLLHPIPVTALTSGVVLLAFSMLFAALGSFIVSFSPKGNRVMRLSGGMVSALLFELVLHYGPFAMPWLSIGYAIAPSALSLGIGSFAGVQGSALFILLISALLAIAFSDSRSSWRTAGLPLVLAAVLFTVPMLAGPRLAGDDSESVLIRILEPDMSPQAWADVNDVDKLDTFISALNARRESSTPVDMTVLPETALPLSPPDSLHAWLSRLALASGSPVVSGGIEWTHKDDAERAFNVVYSSDEPGKRYAKQRLVPFAEHVPFSSWIPFFERFSVPSGGVTSYQPGGTTELLSVDHMEIAPLICFESLFMRDARYAVQMGASILVVTTQDGWWGSDLPRRQHLAFSQMLAASTGRPVVHATVDGESGLIDANGQLMTLSRPAPMILEGPLPTKTRKTAFMVVGNRPFFGIFAALVFAYLWMGFQYRTDTPIGETVA